jgi:hypothetical protein
MADAQADADTQTKYQDVFSAYGETPPPPFPGQEPNSYRRKLMHVVRDKLSTFDERRLDSAGTALVSDMADMDGIDKRLRGQALSNIEEMMLKAAQSAGRRAASKHPAASRRAP